MTDWLAGVAPPETTSTTTKTTEVPQYASDYLQNIVNYGNQGMTGGGVAGLGSLQTEAMNLASPLAFAGADTAGSGASMITSGGSTPASAGINNYLNPYTQGVVNEMARLQNQQVQSSVLPNLYAGAAGTGGFGSRRQAQIAGNTLTNLQQNLLGRQTEALQTGWKDALAAAQADLNRQITAGTAAGNLATQQQDLAKGGLKTLMDMGNIEQAQRQRELDYPMTAAKNYAGLLAPYTNMIPTTTTGQETGVRSGISYGPSPLATLASLMTGLGSFLYGTGGATSGTGSSAFSTALDDLLRRFNIGGNPPPG